MSGLEIYQLLGGVEFLKTQHAEILKITEKVCLLKINYNLKCNIVEIIYKSYDDCVIDFLKGVHVNKLHLRGLKAKKVNSINKFYPVELKLLISQYLREGYVNGK